jgi:nucleotide-binding universal stress UspA family protein
MTNAASKVPQPRDNPLQFKIEKILVPLDFSPASVGALDYAVWLAKQFRAAIHLLHVYPPDEASAPGAGHLLFQSAEAIERLNEELTGIHRKHVPTFRPRNCHIRGGRPYEQIVRLAREIDADLIALSTRGHSGLKHLLLGSTAERVVANAPCPVLVARKRKQRGKASPETFAIRTILVPTDFSQCSLAGTEYAAFLARTLGATLRLFHVIYPYSNYAFVDHVGVRLPGLAEAAEETARQEMDALKQMDFLRDLSVQTEILPGPAVDEMCAAAGEPDVDLIVTSTHGRTGLKHALIGSVAEHVVRYAERPVLVVPRRSQRNAWPHRFTSCVDWQCR